MNKAVAIDAMSMGKKLTHRHFSPGEWVTMTSDGKLLFEDGVKCSPAEFWKWRLDPTYDEDWSFYSDKNYILIEVSTNGNADMYGGQDGHYQRAISKSKEKLNEYCEKTYGKKVGKPEVFSWDNYFVIEETDMQIQ